MKILWKTAIAWLGGILGLTACDSLGWNTCMYATPYADYDVNITVCDEQNTPIPGIKVYPGYSSDDPETYALSDSKGGVQMTLENNSFCILFLEDIDGLENGGEFETKKISESDLTLKQTKKGKDWYSGRYNATGTVTMKKKSSESGQ